MQQTEKYQFNLIEGSDPFSPEPLNQNMEKVEGALEALPRFHLQSWTGNGKTTRTVVFPFQPDLVVLSGDGDGASACIVQYGQKLANRIAPISSDAIHMAWAGTTLTLTPNSYEIPFNQTGRTFFALAIRLTV